MNNKETFTEVRVERVDMVRKLEFEEGMYQLIETIVENVVMEKDCKEIRKTKEFLMLLVQLSEFDEKNLVNLVDTNNIRPQLRKKIDEYRTIVQQKDKELNMLDDNHIDVSTIKRYLTLLIDAGLIERKLDKSNKGVKGIYVFSKKYFGKYSIKDVRKIEIESVTTINKSSNYNEEKGKQKYTHYYVNDDLFKVDVINHDAKLALMYWINNYYPQLSLEQLEKEAEQYNIDKVEESCILNIRELAECEKKISDSNKSLITIPIIECKELPEEKYLPNEDDDDEENASDIQYSYCITKDEKYFRTFIKSKEGKEENRGIDMQFSSYEEMMKQMKEDDKFPLFEPTEDVIN